MGKLNRIIKLKSELTDDHEIIIKNKSVASKVNEKRTKDYYMDMIEELKDHINIIKTYESTQNVQHIILKMSLHLHLLISLVKNMAYRIMHMPLIKLVS
jgi:hypothetical protein